VNTLLVCFSHLRWDFVWQRPQHLMSRFARSMPVVVVEEPVEGGALADLRIAQHGGVTVLTPMLPSDSPGWGFNRLTNRAIRGLVEQYLAAEYPAAEVERAILWYYTPMALGAEPCTVTDPLVVYDAMDELASFRFAPRELRAREAELMSRADLVFAGGPSLYESRRGRHPSVHCFPSGVDVEHFAQAKNGVVRPIELAARRRPILGFYGVLDERVDFDLIAAVADARPDWTLALIGPLAKIRPEDLPQRPNIDYYGQQQYAALPAYLACFDVALLPFARNEATRSISPTKTLEYLAGGKPVVATPIADVVKLYGEVVAFGETPDEFVAAIDRVLTQGLGRHHAERSQAVVAEHTWDAIAANMLGLIEEAAGTGPCFNSVLVESAVIVGQQWSERGQVACSTI
jgi:UDP-galactopyranose mutase